MCMMVGKMIGVWLIIIEKMKLRKIVCKVLFCYGWLILNVLVRLSNEFMVS